MRNFRTYARAPLISGKGKRPDVKRAPPPPQPLVGWFGGTNINILG
jgi:hypothetical protein